MVYALIFISLDKTLLWTVVIPTVT